MSTSRWRNRSPGDLSIELPEVSATSVENEVAAAKRAFPSWSKMPIEKRVKYLRQAQGQLEANKQRLADGIALETGKPLKEAIGEVGAVVAKVDLTIADAERYLKDEPAADNPYPARVRRRPRGPAAVIGPFNFPLHLGHGPLVAHLIAGNTVIFKPSPLAAVVAGEYAKIMKEAFPPGVFNLVQGGAIEGEQLCLHPDVRSICFTGSVPVGRKLAQSLAVDLSKELALELGGKNAAIVLADADLEKAAQAVAEGACLTAGQRCNATSRVIVYESVRDDFLNRFRDAIEQFQPGDPLDERTKLGPLISAAAVERYDRLTRSPGDWLISGKVEPIVNGKRGNYVRPAVVRLDPSHKSALDAEEAFAPIIALYSVRDLDEVLAVHNATPYGLTASIFTKSAEWFSWIADELQVGNVYANLPTTFSPSTLPFGGLRDSGNRRPGGRGFVRFVTDEQAVQVTGLKD